MVNWKNKRVFISGGSGVIGTALVNALIKLGAVLFVGDLKPRPAEWGNLEVYREGDLLTLQKNEIEAFAPEVYFHLAATFERSEESYGFLEENFHHNIALSHHLLSLLKESATLKKVIFASSYLIYDPSLYLHDTPMKSSTVLNETSPIHPRNLCGMAKLLHEEELRLVKQFRPELQIAIARIFRSYGKNSRDIISRWIRALLKKEEIQVFRPEGRFDFVFAEDVAEGLRLLAESSFDGIVNIGTGHSRSIAEVVDILQGQFREIKMNSAKSSILFEASEAGLSRFDEVTKNKLKFRPVEEIIPELIAYEKSLI